MTWRPRFAVGAVPWHSGIRPDDPALAAPPEAPWTLSASLVGLAWHPEAADWLGEFEVCAAWAWLDPGSARASAWMQAAVDAGGSFEA